MAIFRAGEVLPTQLKLLKGRLGEGAIALLQGDGTEGEKPATEP